MSDILKWWWNLDMKYKAYTYLLVLFVISGVLFGCVSSNKEFIRQVEIQIKPILNEYKQVVLEGADLWDGIPEEDVAEGKKLRQAQLDRLNKTITDALK